MANTTFDCTHSIDEVRGLIQSLDGWEASNGVKLRIRERPVTFGYPPEEEWEKYRDPSRARFGVVDANEPPIKWLPLYDEEEVFAPPGEIEVFAIPGGAKLHFDGHGEAFEELAELIERELQALTQAVTEIGVGMDIALQRGKPGRPPDPLYNQAYQRMVKGESWTEAFDWYCKKTGIEKPTKSDRDAFKRAMKRRASKRRQNIS